MANSTEIQEFSKAAILVVNGGQDPKTGKWIEFCIYKILENTEWESYHIFVWNNNVEDTAVTSFLEKIPHLTLVQADPTESLAHPHAVPLQRLYELAKADGFEYIITIDSDAHPIAKGWLTKLINSLDQEIVLSGVWRDELKAAIDPYIHPSCLCTTVGFIEANNLTLDYIAPNTEGQIHDTLSSFTERVKKVGLRYFPLIRSNHNNFHRLMGGIYGDLIYHHGAGSRVGISFWDEKSLQSLMKKNKIMQEETSTLLFQDYHRYIQWLRGDNFDGIIDKKMQEIDQIEVCEEETKLSSGSNARQSKLKICLKKLLKRSKSMLLTN